MMGRRLVRSVALALLAAAVPGIALAHPLGNFTINHYAGIVVARDQIRLDLVIDMAEIPAFQERQLIDADGDGDVTDGEAAAASPGACDKAAAALRLTVNGAAPALATADSAIRFPPGLGGLSTMRIECAFVAEFASPLADRATVIFEDASYPDRIGWREIVASGDGVAIESDGLPSTSPSARLTSYPAELLSQPLAMQSATLVAIPRADARSASQAGAATGAVSSAGAVPGGMGGDLPEIFRAVDLSPLVVMLSVVTALALGAGHALTPGHGKTLMAAYLVGSRGSPVHAVGLGLAVTVSHTLGILVLAVLVVGSQELLPPEVVVRGAPVVAALAIVAIGSWMLIAELRRRFSAARVHGSADGLAHVHQHGLEDEHGHGEHSHGGVRHTHLPQVGSTITWRGLFALGLAGGLIPSTSALFILLGSIVAGRPAFGFVLVVVFGLGMAAVMTAVGLTMVFARGRLDRSASGSLLGRLARHATLVAAAVVLAVGVYLTAQALGRPIL